MRKRYFTRFESMVEFYTLSIYRQALTSLHHKLGLVLLSSLLCNLLDCFITLFTENIVSPSSWEVETLVSFKRIELVEGSCGQFLDL